jgi:hypothetical protein
MLRSGDVVLTKVQFTDTFEVKTRPALILFSEHGNVVIAGITSNTSMDGVPLTTTEGAVKDSVIKLNYIFTVSERMVEKTLFHLSTEKKQTVHLELLKRLQELNGQSKGPVRAS